MASSGIAALLLTGGRTVHSRLKVPIPLNELSVCNIPKQSALAKLVHRAKLLVWDEAPMVHRHGAECIDRTLRDICSCELPFGGKVIVFGGDFRQILPVIRHCTRAQVVSACINRSPLWNRVKVMKLTINMRLQSLDHQDSVEVRKFSELLLRVGEGTEPENESNMIHLDAKYVVRGENIANLAGNIYADIKEKYSDRDYITSHIMMSPKNETTEQINEYVMNQLPGEAHVLLSADSVDRSQAALFPTEFLNSITPTSLPPHRLYLKECASIILLRSLDPTQGMCNGSRLTVRAFQNHVIDAEIATGIHRGKRVFIPRILMMPSETDFPFVLKRKQFPIRPAFCITINKGQSQSLESVGIFLPSPDAIFSHGQLYVALSRVRNPRGLKVMVCGGTCSPSGGVWIRNIVYREVFQNHLGNINPSTHDTPDISLMDLSLNDTRSSTPERLIPLVSIEPVSLTDSVDNFSFHMRMQLAYSVDMQDGQILSTRSTEKNRDYSLQNYYTSLKLRLTQVFGQNFNLCPVMGDGNCLYRTLSHIIFGTETLYDQLKYKMIGKFRDCSEHIMNVMHMSGITCEQELVKHLDQITLENEWGTHVELIILGALAKIDVLVINATHVDQNQWRIDDIYMHNRLLDPTQSSPVYKGQKLGVVLHRLHNKVELYHFDPFYYN